MNTHLHIIGPCAFDFSDKSLRRAGLDYWPNLRWTMHEQPDQFLQWLGDREPWLITKFGQRRFDQAPYQADDVLILGNEVRGLPDDWNERWEQRCLNIPILGPIRAFNLANAAAIVLAHAQMKVGAFENYVPPV